MLRKSIFQYEINLISSVYKCRRYLTFDVEIILTSLPDFALFKENLTIHIDLFTQADSFIHYHSIYSIEKWKEIEGVRRKFVIQFTATFSFCGL